MAFRLSAARISFDPCSAPGVQINIEFYTSNAHYGFLTMGGGEVYTHLTVTLADNNWMSLGPEILHEFSADEYVDSYPYGVRMQVSASGHYGVFDFGKLISQLTTVCCGCATMSALYHMWCQLLNNATCNGGSIWF